jgi:hypothetical protein
MIDEKDIIAAKDNLNLIKSHDKVSKKFEQKLCNLGAKSNGKIVS